MLLSGHIVDGENATGSGLVLCPYELREGVVVLMYEGVELRDVRRKVLLYVHKC